MFTLHSFETKHARRQRLKDNILYCMIGFMLSVPAFLVILGMIGGK